MDSNEINSNEMHNATPEKQPENQEFTDYRPEYEEPVSYGEWLITLIVMMIPCVGLIMVFVWAFSKSEKKSKSNYFKAILTITVATFAFAMLLSVILLFSF